MTEPLVLRASNTTVWVTHPKKRWSVTLSCWAESYGKRHAIAPTIDMDFHTSTLHRVLELSLLTGVQQRYTYSNWEEDS